MNFVRLTARSEPMFPVAMELYRASFPHHEQREAASQEAILVHTEYRFYLIYDGADFVGLLLCWETEDFVYVEHFCILPALRGRDYGSAALRLLRAGGKTVILEIDPPVDDISVRREGFYRRSGFLPNPYSHVHPPYHGGNEGHGLVVLSAPSALSEAEYAAFADYLKHKVMGQ